jgi:hypothetical protein
MISTKNHMRIKIKNRPSIKGSIKLAPTTGQQNAINTEIEYRDITMMIAQYIRLAKASMSLRGQPNLSFFMSGSLSVAAAPSVALEVVHDG